jgi:hypothetical protein
MRDGLAGGLTHEGGQVPDVAFSITSGSCVEGCPTREVTDPGPTPACQLSPMALRLPPTSESLTPAPGLSQTTKFPVMTHHLSPPLVLLH